MTATIPVRLATLATTCALVVAIGFWAGPAPDAAERRVSARSGQLPDLDQIMREKLEYGQSLLEAVVLGQPVAVERYAYELTLLSEASTWTALRTPEYLQYAAAFRDISERLRAAAQDRDMELVSAAYTELVTTCMQCHRHVRGAGSAN